MMARARRRLLVVWILVIAPVVVSSFAGTKVPGPVTRRFKESGEGEARIVGGQEAPVGRYPYAVSLVCCGGAHVCAGSLIAPDIVLTAAHCAGFTNEVYIGHHDQSDASASETFESFALLKEIRYPLYAFLPWKGFDLMIVVLNGNSTAPTVRVNRDAAVPAVNTELTVMGWGQTAYAKEPTLSEVPMEVTVFTISNKDCEQSKSTALWLDSYQGLVTDDMVCASDVGEDACLGDSGGPMILVNETEDDLLVGIVSWGYACAHPDFPGVYSRVTFDLPWLDHTVCSHSKNAPTDFGCGPTSIFPTSSPTSVSQIPVPQDDEIALTVTLQLDSYADEVGFRIERVGFEGVEEVLRIPVGWVPSLRVYTAAAMLRVGEYYSFSIYDVWGDGMCCEYGEGSYQLSLAASDGSVDVPVITASGAFGYGTHHTFLASTNQSTDQIRDNAADNDPGSGPFLTLEIQFDSFPADVGWTLYAKHGRGEAKTPVSFRLPYFYDNAFANETATETIAASVGNSTFLFVLTDRSGDGLCCDYGNGSYKILKGPLNNNEVLASGDARGSSHDAKNFTVSFDSGTMYLSSAHASLQSSFFDGSIPALFLATTAFVFALI